MFQPFFDAVRKIKAPGRAHDLLISHSALCLSLARPPSPVICLIKEREELHGVSDYPGGWNEEK